MAKIPFKISARTASLIGKENIATAEGAIIELVKNSYDADAKNCIIFFDNKSNKNSNIYIIDNGDGMNDKTIEEYWMNIGTSNKLTNPYSSNRRIKSGAKGIGRFALDRLGSQVKMYTIRKGKKGFEWTANWDEFDNTKTLDQVYASLEDMENLDLKSKLLTLTKNQTLLKKVLKDISFKSGTIFQISGLRDEWLEKGIDKLFKNLEVLVPPKETSDFKLMVYSTLYPKKYGIVINSFWDDYDYKLEASFMPDKSININIDRREFNWKNINPKVFQEKQPRDMSKKPFDIETFKQGSFSIETSINEIWPGVFQQYKKSIIDSIGPFTFTFYFLKRSAKEDERKTFAYRNFDANKRREWLDRFGGIKLFRDNFRVRPYGEIGSNAWDWLDLGSRSVASTFGPAQPEGIGWRVNPNQVYGIIKISRIKNPELKDTTNREGLVENETLHAFQSLILRLINIVESDRHFVMRPMRVVYEKENEIARAKEQAKKQADEELVKESKRSSPAKKRSSKTSVYARAVKGFEEELNAKEDEIRMLRSLAGIGMTISTFTHELGQIRRFLNTYSKKLRQLLLVEVNKKKFSENAKLLENPFLLSDRIIDLITSLGNWIDFSNQAIKKDRRKAADLHFSKYFMEFKTRWYEMLKERKVQLIVDESLSRYTIKKAFPIDIDSVFNNLLLNSIDAFDRKDSTALRQINIHGEDDDGGISLIYSDSGPGLLDDIKKPDQIFEAFFSTKKKGNEDVGIGLGMWIVKTTVEQYNGYVQILNDRPGFKIKIFFPTPST